MPCSPPLSAACPELPAPSCRRTNPVGREADVLRAVRYAARVHMHFAPWTPQQIPTCPSLAPPLALLLAKWPARRAPAQQQRPVLADEVLHELGSRHRRLTHFDVAAASHLAAWLGRGGCGREREQRDAREAPRDPDGVQRAGVGLRLRNSWCVFEGSQTRVSGVQFLFRTKLVFPHMVGLKSSPNLRNIAARLCPQSLVHRPTRERRPPSSNSTRRKPPPPLAPPPCALASAPPCALRGSARARRHGPRPRHRSI